MMRKLMHRVGLLVNMEQDLASKTNGPRFHSLHEGYGVIMEELLEANLESENVNDAANSLLGNIHRNNTRRLTGLLTEVASHAKLAAAEYIQVAAMARKMSEGLPRVTHEGETP